MSQPTIYEVCEAVAAAIAAAGLFPGGAEIAARWQPPQDLAEIGPLEVHVVPVRTRLERITRGAFHAEYVVHVATLGRADSHDDVAFGAAAAAAEALEAYLLGPDCRPLGMDRLEEDPEEVPAYAPAAAQQRGLFARVLTITYAQGRDAA